MNQIIMFCSDQCQPCKALKPILNELSILNKIYLKIVDVKIPENNSLVQKYAIRSLPTTIFDKSGAEVDRLVGFKDFNFIQNLINKCFFFDKSNNYDVFKQDTLMKLDFY